MRSALRFLLIVPLALAAQGCSGLSEIRASAATAIATPGTGLLPPTAGTVTEVDRKLRDLPPPQAPVAIAVYGYGDQTGQFKPLAQGAMVQTLSRAVTQGATSILIKALQDAGNGRWFTVIERERLDNPLKERRIIADMRTRYLGEQAVLQFIVEGAARGLWSFKDRGFQSRMIEDCELSYLATAAKEDSPPPAKHASAAAKPAAPQAGAQQTARLAAGERQQASAGGNSGSAPQAKQPGQQPVQAFTVQPRTLEDEVPISPR